MSKLFVCFTVTTICNYTAYAVEWDEAKRRANLWIHGIDFAAVEKEHVFAGETFTRLDDRFDYGERRFQTLGLLKGAVVSIIHTEIEEVVRLISVRKASKNEENIYFKEIKNRAPR